LYQFAIGVGGEDFVGNIGYQMEQYGYQHVASRFVIQPVDDKHKGKQTYKKVGCIEPPLSLYIALVVVFYEEQGQMPQPPIDGKDER
jgi:hypothetical protein